MQRFVREKKSRDSTEQQSCLQNQKFSWVGKFVCFNHDVASNDSLWHQDRQDTPALSSKIPWGFDSYWGFVLDVSSGEKGLYFKLRKSRADSQHKSTTSLSWAQSTILCCSRATLADSASAWSSLEGEARWLLVWWTPSAQRWHSTLVSRRSAQDREAQSDIEKLYIILNCNSWSFILSCSPAREPVLLGTFWRSPAPPACS